MRLQKTSSRCLQDVLIKTNIFVLAIGLQDVLQKRLQDILKASSRRFKDVFKTSLRRLQDIFKTSCKDFFKTFYQAKLFLLTQFQDVFETWSKRFWDILLRRLSTRGFAYWLYVFVMSGTRFRVNRHSIVASMSRNSLLEAGAKSEV